MSNTVPDPVTLPSSREATSGGETHPTEVPRRLLTLGTLVKYAFGDRAAIVTLAEHPGALWIGFLFVISAGFAREYDGVKTYGMSRGTCCSRRPNDGGNRAAAKEL